MLNKKFCLTLAVCLPLFYACQDEDFGFSKEEIRQSVFDRDFVSTFGAVDPLQDWTGLNAGMVTVTCDENSRVSIYPENSTLVLREMMVEGGLTTRIAYDAPVGVKNILIVAKSETSWQTETAPVGYNKEILFAGDMTRALTPEQEAQLWENIKNIIKGRVIDHVYGAYNFSLTTGDKVYHSEMDGNIMHGPSITYQNNTSYYFDQVYNDENTPTYKLPDWGMWYAQGDWTNEVTINNNSTNPSHSSGVGSSASTLWKDGNGIPTEISSDAVELITGAMAGHDHYFMLPYTQNYAITTLKETTIDLVSIYDFSQHSAPMTLGYYYIVNESNMNEEQRLEAAKKAPKIIITPNVRKVFQEGFCFFPEFYGEGENFDIQNPGLYPANTTIHFFTADRGDYAFNTKIQPVRYLLGFIPEYGPVYGPYYGLRPNNIYFTDPQLNDGLSPMAAFSVAGLNVLSFDNLADPSNVLWKDFTFVIRGDIAEFPRIDDTQEYTVACEDLGGSFDFDYNDVVFKVSHPMYVTNQGCLGCVVQGSEEIELDLVAAGGWQPVSIWYDRDSDGTLGADAITITETPADLHNTAGKDIIIVPEIHAAFNTNTGIPVNVDSKKELNMVDGVDRQPVKYYLKLADLGWSSDTNVSDMLKNFHITVLENWNHGTDGLFTGDASEIINAADIKADGTINSVSVPKQMNSVPYCFVVPSTANRPWVWPNENVVITKIYPNFLNWVSDRDSSAKWYDTDAWWENVSPAEGVDNHK